MHTVLPTGYFIVKLYKQIQFTFEYHCSSHNTQGIAQSFNADNAALFAFTNVLCVHVGDGNGDAAIGVAVPVAVGVGLGVGVGAVDICSLTFFAFRVSPPPQLLAPLECVCVWVCECRTWPWLNPIQRWSLVLSILFSVFIVSLRGLIKVNKFLSFFLALPHSLSLPHTFSLSLCLLLALFLSLSLFVVCF